MFTIKTLQRGVEIRSKEKPITVEAYIPFWGRHTEGEMLGSWGQGGGLVRGGADRLIHGPRTMAACPCYRAIGATLVKAGRHYNNHK